MRSISDHRSLLAAVMTITLCGGPAGATKLIKLDPILDPSVNVHSGYFKLNAEYTGAAGATNTGGITLRGGVQKFSAAVAKSAPLLKGGTSTIATPMDTVEYGVAGRFHLNLEAMVPKLAPDMQKHLDGLIEKERKKLAALSAVKAPIEPYQLKADKQPPIPAIATNAPNGIPEVPRSAPRSVPDKMPSLAATEKLPSIVVPNVRNPEISPGLASGRAMHGIAPTSVQHGFAPTSVQHGFAPTSVQHGVAPTSVQHGIASTSGAHPVRNVPNVNASLAVPNVKTAISVPNVTASISVPNVNTSISVPNVNASIAVPKTNASLLVPRNKVPNVDLATAAKLSVPTTSVAMLPAADRSVHTDVEMLWQRTIDWSSWHRNFAELAKLALAQRVGNLSGENTVEITVDRDRTLNVRSLNSSNEQFDQAVLTAYRSLAKKPGLQFPVGSMRTQVIFKIHNERQPGDMLSTVRSTISTTDKEIVKQ